jgi:hypothetical protein
MAMAACISKTIVIAIYRKPHSKMPENRRIDNKTSSAILTMLFSCLWSFFVVIDQTKKEKSAIIKTSKTKIPIRRPPKCIFIYILEASIAEINFLGISCIKLR